MTEQGVGLASSVTSWGHLWEGARVGDGSSLFEDQEEASPLIQSLIPAWSPPERKDSEKYDPG